MQAFGRSVGIFTLRRRSLERFLFLSFSSSFSLCSWAAASAKSLFLRICLAACAMVLTPPSPWPCPSLRRSLHQWSSCQCLRQLPGTRRERRRGGGERRWRLKRRRKGEHPARWLVLSSTAQKKELMLMLIPSPPAASHQHRSLPLPLLSLDLSHTLPLSHTHSHHTHQSLMQSSVKQEYCSNSLHTPVFARSPPSCSPLLISPKFSVMSA